MEARYHGDITPWRAENRRKRTVDTARGRAWHQASRGRQLWIFLIHCLALQVVKCSFPSSITTIGASDPGGCDTTGKFVDANMGRDEFAVTGLTKSLSLITGSSFAQCRTDSVPFIQVWYNSALRYQRYFVEPLYQDQAIAGRYYDVACTAF